MAAAEGPEPSPADPARDEPWEILAALAQSHGVAAIRREADATVARLASALKTRADETRRRQGDT